MTDFLTEEWFEAVLATAGELPAHDGSSAEIGFEVAGGPTGKKMRASASLVDGQLVGFAIGKPADATCSIVIDAAIARDVLTGELDPAVAYMRGDIKVNDAYEQIVFDLQPLFGSPPWQAFMEQAVAATTFS